jgi:hypothetical protein
VIQEEVRIGDAMDPDRGFSEVGAVDVDRDGSVYVFDAQDTQMKVYDSAGRLLRRFGRRGQGPGEFDRFVRMGIVGDTVWTIDSFRGRIALFDRQGRILATGLAEAIDIPIDDRTVRVRPSVMLPDGYFVGSANAVMSAHAPKSAVRPDSIPIPRVRFTAKGEVLDTIGWDEGPSPRLVPPADYVSPESDPVRMGSQRFRVPVPPTTLPWWNSLPGGTLVVAQPLPGQEDAAIEITRVGLHRDTIYHRRVSYRARRYDAAVLDSIAAEAARDPSGGTWVVGQRPALLPSADPLVVRTLRGKMDFPEYRPAIEFVWMANDESAWLRRHSAADVSRWILLDVDGLPRGEVVLPRGARPVWARGDAFFTVELDELDVPWLVRYRIAAPE